MAAPDVPLEILDRLSRVEDAVQRFEFVHLVKVDATTAGLGVLYAQQQRLADELTGFRAETAAELEALKTEQAMQSETLDGHTRLLQEILDRLPSRA